MWHARLWKGVAHARQLAFVGLVSQEALLAAPQLCGQGVGLAALLAVGRALTCVQALVGMQHVGGLTVPCHTQHIGGPRPCGR